MCFWQLLLVIKNANIIEVREYVEGIVKLRTYF